MVAQLTADNLSWDNSLTQLIEAKVEARNAARAAKNWPESDRIRDELLAQNFILKDHKDGTTTWEMKR